MAKPKIAVFKFSSCAGCQLEIVNLENVLLDVLGAIDIAYFVMASRDMEEGPYDIGFVEGAVTSPHEIERIKEVRKNCKILVAMGTCACTGGLPSIKNWTSQREMESRVYTELWAINSTTAYGIDHYVPVDVYLRGCPISLDELVDLVKSVLLGVSPPFRPYSVCVECKLKENACQILKGKPCMGSVTAAGCGALCPSHNKGCEGCRGPSNDANAASLARTFADMGLSKADVVRKFRKYAGNTPQFKEGAEAL
jgi:sulfhydrogenase subunit delta